MEMKYVLTAYTKCGSQYTRTNTMLLTLLPSALTTFCAGNVHCDTVQFVGTSGCWQALWMLASWLAGKRGLFGNPLHYHEAMVR